MLAEMQVYTLNATMAAALGAQSVVAVMTHNLLKAIRVPSRFYFFLTITYAHSPMR